MLTFQYSPGYAVQVARPLTEVDESLVAAADCSSSSSPLAGVGVAAALGLIVSRAALAPVRQADATRRSA